MKKSLKKVMLFGAMLLALGASFVGCKDYDDDIDDLNNKIDNLAKSLQELESKFPSGYVKSVTYNESTGVLTVLGENGQEVTYKTHQEIKEYNIELKGNVLYVNDVAVGNVEIPAVNLTADEDGWILVNGEKSSVQLPSVTEVEGVVLTLDENKQILVNGEETGIFIPTGDMNLDFEFVDGELYLNGEATGAKLPEYTSTTGTIIRNKEDGTITINLLNEEGNWDSVTFIEKSYSTLTSLAFIPEWIENGMNQAPYYRIVGSNNQTLATAWADLQFRINPISANVKDVSWNFLARAAKITSRAAGDEYGFLTYNKDSIKVSQGTVTLSTAISDYSIYTAAQKENKEIIFALEATIPVVNSTVTDDLESTVIVSDYIQAKVFDITDVFIGDTVKLLTKKDDGTYEYKLEEVDYKTTRNSAKYDNGTSGTLRKADHTISYIDTVGNPTTIDLMDYVVSSVDLEGKRTLLKNIGINDYTYEFLSEDNWNFGSDGETDQQYYVSLPKGSSKVTVERGTAAIGRRPIFEVRLKSGERDNKQTLATAYIQFEITDTEITGGGWEVPKKKFNYENLYTTTEDSISVSWKNMSDHIYTNHNLTHEMFVQNYNVIPEIDYGKDSIWAKKVLTDYGVELGTVITNFNGNQQNTVPIGLFVSPKTKFGDHIWDIIFKSDNSRYGDIKFTFNFTIERPAKPEFDDNYVDKDKGNLVITKGYEKNNSYQMEFVLAEAFEYYMKNGNNSWKATVDDKIQNDTHGFAFRFTDNNPVLSSAAIGENANAITGAINNYPGATDYLSQRIYLTQPLLQASRTYNVVFRSVWENEEIDETKFTVRFDNPLDIKVAELSLETLYQETSLNLYDYIRVSLKGRTLYIGSKVANANESIGWQPQSDFFVDQNNAFTFSNLTTDKTDPDNLKLDPATGIITWMNKGGTLLGDIKESVKITFTTDYAIQEETPTITLLKSPEE